MNVGINWTYQPIDNISIKSPLGWGDDQTQPTYRSKLDIKRHILIGRKRIPLCIYFFTEHT